VRDRPDAAAYPLVVAENRAFLGDAGSVLAKLEPEIADCVFLDPPYYLQLSGQRLRRWGANSAVNGVDDAWDRFASFDHYDALIERTLAEIRRVMKPTATLWAIGTYHNIFRIGKAMQDMGFWLLNDVTWIKTNPMPNWLGVRFTNATETLIWAARDKGAKGYAFNREAAKRYGIGKVAAGVWVLPVCAGRERVKGEGGKKAHAAQKPAELLRRVIATSTREGDLVLDPMAGVGTTGYVARALGRRFIMIEKAPEYLEAMRGRFQAQVGLATARAPDAARTAEYLKLADPG
jgi:DNA modification methylase